MGSQALGQLIDIYVVEFTEQVIIQKILNSTTYIHKCDLEGNGIISETEYAIFKLQQMDKVDKDLMARITSTFSQLDKDNTGYIEVGIDYTPPPESGWTPPDEGLKKAKMARLGLEPKSPRGT